MTFLPMTLAEVIGSGCQNANGMSVLACQRGRSRQERVKFSTTTLKCQLIPHSATSLQEIDSPCCQSHMPMRYGLYDQLDNAAECVELSSENAHKDGPQDLMARPNVVLFRDRSSTKSADMAKLLARRPRGQPSCLW